LLLGPMVPFLHDQGSSSQPTRHYQPACKRSSERSRWSWIGRPACVLQAGEPRRRGAYVPMVLRAG
jgi:hypothetical protein